MHIFQNRPLALAACVLAVIAVFAQDLPANCKLILLSLSLISCLVLAIYGSIKRKLNGMLSTCFLCLLSVAIALFGSWLFFNQSVSKIEAKAGNTCQIEGYVCEVLTDQENYSRYRIQLCEFDGAYSKAQILLECRYSAGMELGDEIRLTGTVCIPQDTPSYPERQLIFRDGMSGKLSSNAESDCSILEGQTQTLSILFAKWNQALSERLVSALGGEEGALAAALLLGNRAALSAKTTLDFRRAGISHLLALSGLHVSVLIAILEFLLQKLHLPKKARAIIIPVFSLIYLALTGFSVSMIRAVLMTCVIYLGYLFSELYDSFTALCAVFMLIIVSMPYAICDISLWMSFAAAAGIVLFLPAIRDFFAGEWIKRLPRFPLKLLKGLTVSLAVGLFANAMILLLSAAFFGYTSLFSIPVTLLLSPLLTPALILSILSLLFPHFSLFSIPAGWCMQTMLRIADITSNLPNGTVWLDGSRTMLLLCLLGISLFICATFPLRRKLLLIVPILLSISVMYAGYTDKIPASEGISVTYLQNKNSDLILVCEEKTAMLIDCSGGESSYDELLEPALHDARCTELSELIYTHYHAKMSRQLAALTTDLHISKLRLPIPQSEQERLFATSIVKEATTQGIEVVYGGTETTIPSVQILAEERSIVRTEEAVVFFSLKIHNQVFSYHSSGFFSGETAERVQNILYETDHLLLGTHGVAPNENESLFPKLPQKLKQLICANPDLAEAYFAVPYQTNVVRSVEYYQFFLKKAA